MHMPTDGCSAEDDIILINWNETEIGQFISQPCPCQDLIGNSATQNGVFNITRRCGGSYSMGGRWEDVEYKIQCGLTDIALELCRLQANIVSITNYNDIARL